MPLPLATAKAAKTMPKGKGYGGKKSAAKKPNPFAKKDDKKGAKAPAKKGGLPPALAKKAAEMKAKKAKKAPKKGSGRR